MDWNVPLIISALLFSGFLIWRIRPSFGDGGTRKHALHLLAEAKRRIELATNDATRAQALCDAGDACAQSLGRTTGAVGYYLRAMRTDPTSAALVERAASGLARRPLALEHLLWRKLGASPWDGEKRAAALAALRHLALLYSGPLRNRPRGRALAYTLASLGEPITELAATSTLEARDDD